MKTLKQVREALGGIADTVGKNKAGNFVARREYFYHHGITDKTFAASVSKALPGARIKKCGYFQDECECAVSEPPVAGSATGSAALPEITYEHVIVSPPDPVTMTSEADVFADAVVNGQHYKCLTTVQVKWVKQPNVRMSDADTKP